MTRREAIAHALERWAPNAEDHEVDRFEDVLRAAGFVVVPREPTTEMWAASGTSLCNGRVKIKAHHDYLSETVWTAMLEAAP